MRRRLTWCATIALGLGAVAVAPARADEPQPVIQDVLEILKERGLVDDGQYNELVAKNESYEEKHQGLLGRIQFSGDMRLRYENFWFNEDELNVNRSERTRLRYRLRLAAKVEINEWVDAVFRLASGEGAPNSTNRTLGVGNDFDPDAIFIDQAYLVLRAPESWLDGASVTATGGKLPNPFLWKAAKWDAFWDYDINPEGVGIDVSYAPGENLQLFSKVGYLIDQENATAVDPHVLGIQGGLVWTASELVELGARGTWYSWGSLNSAFIGRAANAGSISDGLTGSDLRTLNVFELAGYLRFSGIEGWPVLVYGQVGKNLDAEASELFPGVGAEDLGWLVGAEVGDRKKLLALGVAYAWFEANFWPAQFTDSDFFDGFTNRKGWGFYGSREILPNTELTVTLYWCDQIQDAIPAFDTSIANAKRLRLQTDLQVKF